MNSQPSDDICLELEATHQRATRLEAEQLTLQQQLSELQKRYASLEKTLEDHQYQQRARAWAATQTSVEEWERILTDDKWVDFTEVVKGLGMAVDRGGVR